MPKTKKINIVTKEDRENKLKKLDKKLEKKSA